MIELCREKQNKLVSRNTIICFHLNKSVECCSHCQGLNFIIFRGKKSFLFVCLLVFFFPEYLAKVLLFCFPKETALFLYKASHGYAKGTHSRFSENA